MGYKVKFRVIGDKPPFTVTLHENSVNEPAVIKKTVTTSNIIDYLEDTQTYTISPIKEYCIKAVDSISNNVHVCDITYPDLPPYVVNVTLGGSTVVGSQLTGSYLYYDDNGDPESGSLFKWYRSDDNKGTNKIQISGVFTQQYTLTNDDIGKYIQFSVTPKNLNATGDEVFSNYRGIVKDHVLPQISDYTLNNTLIWSMSDNSEAPGTWIVEYSLDNSTWKPSYAGGSPRSNVLPVAIYNQTIYFRVKRISTPVTEYSNVFSKFVYQVHNYSQLKTSPVNVFDGTGMTVPGPDFCFTGNRYTASNIYLEDQVTTVQSGVQLYFIANDGFIRPATKDNLLTYPSQLPTGGFTSGISHIRFVVFNNEVWDVNPITGQLINISALNGICNSEYLILK